MVHPPQEGSNRSLAYDTLSGCLMVDVPCWDHLWDGRMDPLDVGQVRCSQQETPRKIHHCMLLGLSWHSYHAWINRRTICRDIIATTDDATRGDV